MHRKPHPDRETTPAPLTEYVVLMAVTVEEDVVIDSADDRPEPASTLCWKPLKSVEARSIAAAIDAATSNGEGEPKMAGRFKAVPIRSWKPMIEHANETRTVTTTTTSEYVG